MPIFAPNWIFSRFTTWIFGGVRILLVGQGMSLTKVRAGQNCDSQIPSSSWTKLRAGQN